MKNEKIVPCGYCKKPIHINDFGGMQKGIGLFHAECHLEAERQALKQADVIKSVCPHCSGTGKAAGYVNNKVKCNRCDGTGQTVL